MCAPLCPGAHPCAPGQALHSPRRTRGAWARSADWSSCSARAAAWVQRWTWARGGHSLLHALQGVHSRTRLQWGKGRRPSCSHAIPRRRSQSPPHLRCTTVRLHGFGGAPAPASPPPQKCTPQLLPRLPNSHSILASLGDKSPASAHHVPNGQIHSPCAASPQKPVGGTLEADPPFHGDNLQVASKVARVQAADGKAVTVASQHDGAVLHSWLRREEARMRGERGIRG